MCSEPTHGLGDCSFVAAAALSDSVSRTLRTNRLAYLLLLMLCRVNVKKVQRQNRKSFRLSSIMLVFYILITVIFMFAATTTAAITTTLPTSELAFAVIFATYASNNVT